MAKVRFMAVILLVAMASLSVGFAATEAIYVGPTVQTGRLQVDLGSTTVVCDEYVTAQKFGSDDGRSVTIMIGNLYPGAEVDLHVKALNIGSLSVAFDSVAFKWSGSTFLMPYLQVISGYQYDGDGNGNIDGGESLIPSWAGLDTIADTMNASATLKDMVIRPNGAFYLGTPVDPATGSFDYPLKIRLSPDAPNATQNTSVTFSLALNWEQATNQCWNGDVEVRWYRVECDNCQGWDVYGDVYLIHPYETRTLYRERAVTDHFSGSEKIDHKTGSFWVEYCSMRNHFQVEVTKVPPTAPQIVHPHN